MSTCDTCRWWTAPTTWEVGIVERKTLTTNYGECSCESVNDSDSCIEVGSETTKPLDHASPFCSDEHGLGFGTGPKFGCIHWEPKP